MPVKTLNSQQLQDELDQIIEWFESDDSDIDQAAEKYKRGLELINKLKENLKVTKNVIKKLNQTFTD